MRNNSTLVLVAMNIIYATSAYPWVRYQNRLDRRTILLAGFAVLIAADVVLALTPTHLGRDAWRLYYGACRRAPVSR